MVEFTHPQLLAIIRSSEECLSEINDAVNQFRHLSSKFLFLDFHVTSGSCNKAAKLLASSAKGLVEPSVWMEEGPACILPIVLSELS